MTDDEYLSHDATALAALVRAGETTAVELLEIALGRVAALDPEINAVVYRMEADARASCAREPTGPFAGVPFLAKDLISSFAGHPTSAGSRLLVDHTEERDSELVRRLRETGVSVLGKTNLPEWGLLPYTEPELWGPCRNPWDTNRTPGGSSGGSAAAVAAGMVPMAGAGDGAGSIRIPASCCGLFGLKPTRARTPTGPRYGQLWRGAVVEHVLTRSVRDSARMLDATHGPEPGAPFEIPPPPEAYEAQVGADPGSLRIAWTAEPTLGSSTVHPDCVSALERTVTLLEELGHDLVEAAPPLDAHAFSHAFLTMMLGELAADLDDAAELLGRAPTRSDLEPETWAGALLGKIVTAREFASALRTLELAGRGMGEFFSGFDLLLTPTVATPPPRVGAMRASGADRALLRILGAMGSGRLIKAAGLLERLASEAFDFLPWLPVYNATGQPAMSVPLWWNDAELPIGVHFVARFGQEHTLFRLAGQLERAQPWFDRVPKLARGA